MRAGMRAGGRRAGIEATRRVRHRGKDKDSNKSRSQPWRPRSILTISDRHGLIKGDG